MKIPVIIWKDEDWNLIAESPVLPWFHTWWKNEEELFKNLKEVRELYKELIQNGEIQVKWQDYLMSYFVDLKIEDGTNNFGQKTTATVD